jgi:hypothetical protein
MELILYRPKQLHRIFDTLQISLPFGNMVASIELIPTLWQKQIYVPTAGL